MSIHVGPHTKLELSVAESLFDEFQKSINRHVHTTHPYANKFDHLEARHQQAWIDVARSVISVKGGTADAA